MPCVDVIWVLAVCRLKAKKESEVEEVTFKVANYEIVVSL
jgi:hypothetical protein